MAENPYVNKVEYAGQTLMDLTGDTVTPSDVLNGATFHDRSGAPQTGNLITHNVYDGLDSTSGSDALSANQGRVLNEAIANTQSSIAYIVGNKNTTGLTLSVGQFVYVKGHSSIAEGLRKVTASISSNGSITTNNTTAVSGGGLNELNSNITTLNGKLGQQIYDIAYTDAASVRFNVPGNGRYLFIITSASNSANGYVALVSSTIAGTLNIAELFKGSAVTVSTDTNVIALTFPSANNRYYLCCVLNDGNLMSLITN